MVNYSKWDAIGDSSDDEAPSRLAQDVETKLAVAPPQAPPRNPKAEVLTDRANQVVNSLIEKHGEDKSRLLGPDERAAYREACTLYDGALKNMEVKDDKLSSRILLNMATCHWQVNEFGPARKAASKALDFAVAEDKGRAQDIVDACDRELRRVAATTDGVDHAAAGDAALHAKDFAAGAKHFSALAKAFKGSGGEDEIHALAHLALCYEQQSKFGEAASHYDRAAEVCDKTDQASASVPRRAQLAQRAQMCYEKNGEDSKSAASCARETRRCADDAELALKCAGAFAQRYRKEKKSKALVLPALTVAVETATKARKRDPKCLKTASQRLLLATVLDALADGLSTQKQFKDALPKAERALKEYDAVAKAHLRAKNEDENFRARRAAAGCALAVASCRAALHKYDDAGDQFRDASNRYAGVSEFLRAGQAALSAARCFTNAGCSPEGTQGTIDAEGGPGAAANVEDYQQAAKLLAIALDLPKNSADDKAAIQSLLAKSLVGAGRPNDAVGPAKSALAYLDAKPRSENDSKDRASACETLADALAGADRLRDAASCLEKAAVYCFENDQELGTAGAQHLFNAAGALQKCGDGDESAAMFRKARDAYKRLGHPKAAQTAQEHAEAALRACAEAVLD